jgi:hypothetical protein
MTQGPWLVVPRGSNVALHCGEERAAGPWPNWASLACWAHAHAGGLGWRVKAGSRWAGQASQAEMAFSISS